MRKFRQKNEGVGIGVCSLYLPSLILTYSPFIKNDFCVVRRNSELTQQQQKFNDIPTLGLYVA
jgi:hypothetical protein